MIARVNESKGVQPLLQPDLSQINLRVHELSNEIVPSHQNKIIERYNVKITACIGDAWALPTPFTCSPVTNPRELRVSYDDVMLLLTPLNCYNCHVKQRN